MAASINDLEELPYPYSSIIVMEKSNVWVDAEGNTILDNKNMPQKAEVTGPHVMRREMGFGTEYRDNKTGEWEYVEYRPDGSYLTHSADFFCMCKVSPESGR